MFFNSLINPESSFNWLIFHIILGLICTITPIYIIFWFYIVLLTNIGKTIKDLRAGLYFPFIALIFYLISFEMLGRMAKTAPFIPTELGKYLLIVFSIVGMLVKGVRSKVGFLMGILLSVALVYDLSEQRIISDLIFNFMGSFSLALGIAFFLSAPISENAMNQILRLIWLTSISALVYTIIKTPDLDTIEFKLNAEFATTADTSSNQVATIFGLGMFLSFYSIINRLKFSGNYYTDIAFMLLFAFQGLLSFSRGGMIVAGFGMVILIIFNSRRRVKVNRVNLIAVFIIAMLGLYFIFQTTNKITDGNLLLRYQGETQGTLLGSKEKSNDVLLSGRLTISEEDLDLWKEHFILGVGAGSSRYLRKITYLVSPHIELTRLLAEHGLFGLIYFILLLSIFWKIYRRLSPSANKGLFLALFIIALLTTFHAAMRTYVSPILFILASISIVPNAKRRCTKIKDSFDRGTESSFST